MIQMQNPLHELTRVPLWWEKHGSWDSIPCVRRGDSETSRILPISGNSHCRTRSSSKRQNAEVLQDSDTGTTYAWRQGAKC